MRESVEVFTTKVAVALALTLGTTAATTAIAEIKGDEASSPARGAAETVIVGPARIVDGDTIEISGRRIRLEGIDAPEMDQTCRTASAAPGTWACGQSATRALTRLIAGRWVRCHGEANDAYRRLIATCFVGRQNISAWLVKNGFAWAFIKYSQRYSSEEEEARKVRIGLWAIGAAPQPPWEFRATRWAAAEQIAPQGCPIKGNITKRGRIYHTPWSRWYRKVRISPGRGERWFCSENEALAAGWRAAKAR